ncbi:MAG TPA: carbamoyltransferase [Candidatus Sulfotelmatobacter sp.]|nr:carbamoyltransferase [Candidatus Sulfotelmatobacter sp.]
MTARSTHVLGISCFYHDSAAALLRDGVVVAAGQEERFSRKKHDSDFPVHAIRYVLKEAGVRPEELDAVGFYDKPLLKFERMLSTYTATFPRSFGSFRKAMPVWLKEKLWVPSIIRRELRPYRGPIYFAEHHMSHAASCFLPSPFEEAAILTIDGVGEWATASYGVGRGTDITMLKEIRFPHSLGLLYSAFTYYLGFKVNSAEYKVMGLAPYGKPVHFDRIMRDMVQVNEDGSFKLDMKYFSYDHGLRMTNQAFDQFFGGPPRKPETWMNEREFDIAASIQKVCEEIVLRMARHLHGETGLTRLCMAGGVALNCVANGRVIRETPFKELWVQPAAGDAGGAVGVAHYLYNTIHKQPRAAGWTHAYLGPEFSDAEIARYLEGAGAKYTTLADADLVARTAKLISEGEVVGWFQGRMEFGPRALGGRSILADPRDPKMRDTLNMKIKFREGFRPFAPSVLLDKAAEWFEIDCDSPYMLLVAQVREGRRCIPSVTHVDNSARLQTVTREEAPLYYDLIREFERITGVPIVINTSFNVRGEPIVCTPHDAYLCFMRTNMDHLVLGHHLLDKKEQPPLREDVDWRSLYALD